MVPASSPGSHSSKPTPKASAHLWVCRVREARGFVNAARFSGWPMILRAQLLHSFSLIYGNGGGTRADCHRHCCAALPLLMRIVFARRILKCGLLVSGSNRQAIHARGACERRSLIRYRQDAQLSSKCCCFRFYNNSFAIGSCAPSEITMATDDQPFAPFAMQCSQSIGTM